MGRYIDAKWLQESLELADECKDCKRNVDKCVYSNIDVGVVCNAIDDAPTIDIVFCKECKKHNTHRCHMAFDLVATNADDFCSYGERKDEPQAERSACGTCKHVNDYDWCRDCGDYGLYEPYEKGENGD